MKRSILMTVAACAVALAQTPPSMVAPAKSLDATLSALEKEMIPLAEAMPADKYSFAPSADLFKAGLTPNYKGVRTFAQTIVHISQANFSLAVGVGGKTMDTEMAARLTALAKLTEKADLVKALKDSFAAAHAAIATLTPENAWEHAGRGPDNTRAEQAIYIVAHARDHYGQLVEYIRMNGIVPPASEGRPLANPAKTN
jgi:hypothetical protein